MKKPNDAAAPENATAAKRVSDRELVVTRTLDAPVRRLFAAWTRPELFSQWWVPKSTGLTLLDCTMNVWVGGQYRLEFGHPAVDQPMVFFGTYSEVVENARLVWTNDEGPQGAITTVTFEEQDGKTRLVVHVLYPSREALDDEIASGATAGMRETLAQLAHFVNASPG